MKDPKREAVDGDHAFMGVNLRVDPSNLQPGELADGENLRFRLGVAETRKGIWKPAWCNRVDVGTPTKVQPYGIIYGAGTYKDPGSVEWIIIAADGFMYRTRQMNASQTLNLPTGVKVLGRCRIVQTFDKIYLFRGRDFPPLRCSDLSVGFTDILAHWSSAGSYNVGDEVSFGPTQTVTLTSASNTVTAVAASAHGFVTGMDVEITGANQAEYNGRVNVTVVDSLTVTYGFVGSVTTPATGTIKASNNANYWIALGSRATLSSLTRKTQTVTSITRAVAVATATLNSHGFSNGDSITIAGANETEYNGTFVISNVTTNTWDYAVPPTPASPATGTITARTFRKLVATSNAHGFSNGQTVTISGATPTSLNVTSIISNAAANTFEVVGPGSEPGADGTGTMFARNTIVLGGQNPETNAEAWQRLYNILPNADDALFVNNRLLVATAYAPGGTAYGSTSNYTKKDYIVATDYLDETHFDFASEFRINQGSNDEITGIEKFADDTTIVFKGQSWGALRNVAFDLSNVSLDMRDREWGLVGQGASCVAAGDIYFVVRNRGVCSLRQTEQNKVQSVDLPLSDEVQPIINRINWNYGDKIRLAYWDSKLYCALPLNDGVVGSSNLAANLTYDSTRAPPGPFGYKAVTGFVVGKRYLYVPGNSSSCSDGIQNVLVAGISFNSSAGTVIKPGYFTAASGTYYLWGGLTGATVTAVLRPAITNSNNSILVYDFLTRKWSGIDTGSGICVKEFFKATFRGEQRLFFAGEDGFISVIEESYSSDQVLGPSSSTGLALEEITTRWRTRSYPGGNQSPMRATEVLLTLETWNPSYSAKLLLDGANEKQDVNSSGVTTYTRNRVKYYRPFDALDWTATNVNDDHATPYRQDYSVPITSSGIYCGASGMQTDLYQDTGIRMGVTPQLGRAVQVEVTTSQGRAKLQAVEVEMIKTAKRKDVLA